jgi:capsule polysaccharide export protein KpsC/LpsZ
LQVFINDLDFSNPVHVHVIKKWFRKAAVFIDYILPYFQKTRFAKVIILQGHLYDSAIIRWICIERGVPIVAVENTFNKDKIIWDDISCLSVNKNLARNFYWRYRDVIDCRKATEYCTEYLTNIRSKKQNEHYSPNKKLLLDNSRKSIFYIGQVFTDASTLFGIGNFHNPVSIIEYLVKYAINENYNLVIKLHPKEISGIDICQNRYDSLTHKQIKSNPSLYDLIKQNINIYYDHANTYDTYSIIQKADICVTINSQAGLESLLLGKIVITCGNAFYSCLNSVYQALDIRHIGFFLNRTLKNTAPGVDMDQVYKFFYIFCEKYCLPKNEKSFLWLFEKSILNQGQRN